MIDLKKIDFLVKFVVESDAIEGIKRNPEQVRSQFIAGHTEGHVGAITDLVELAKSKDSYLNDSIVLTNQALITSEQHLLGERKLAGKYIGRYRDCAVMVGGRICPSEALVPVMMDDWIKDVIDFQISVPNQSSGINLYLIARLHWGYEMLHPFADGNGRSGRALALYMMLYAGLDPFMFTSSDRVEKYYPCFSSQGPQVMIEYFRNRCKI
jgi:Fic family protein